jgi:hypothetical protein
MKISKEQPPNYEKILKFFDVKDENVVFAYGDTIYAPNGGDIPEHLVVHEVRHSKQQGTDPEGWWDKYLVDAEFRLEQEVQAYASQYVYIKRLYKTSTADQFLDKLASDLSSKIYGNIVIFDKARSRIKHFAKNML